MPALRRVLLLSFLFLALKSHGQDASIQYTGELGISAGGAEYFGDLNTNSSFKGVHPSVGIFYRRFFNEYIGIRGSFHFAQLGFSDIYNTNDFEHRRNLSFNTNIWEVAIQGDFNFFKFTPGTDDRFTPYLTFGIGLFSFNPYAYYLGQKYYLQPLYTEGQGSFQYPDRKPYSLQAICFPLGAGLKYNINSRINVGMEVVHRFTTTHYLDDVSKTYAGISAFPPPVNGKPDIAYILQDRSGATGTPIGIAGRQRGGNPNNDQYILFELNISILFTTYLCPKMH